MVRTVVYLLIGIAGLPLGAHLIVEGGVGVAQALNIPDYIIGITIIAIGTSLPEIGAGVAAAMRGQGSVLIGNILGSNVFNILGAGGLVALMSSTANGPLRMTEAFHTYDHWAMALAALTVAGVILTGARISRLAGLALLLVYVLYIYGLTQGWNLMALFGAG